MPKNTAVYQYTKILLFISSQCNSCNFTAVQGAVGCMDDLAVSHSFSTVFKSYLDNRKVIMQFYKILPQTLFQPRGLTTRSWGCFSGDMGEGVVMIWGPNLFQESVMKTQTMT